MVFKNSLEIEYNLLIIQSIILQKYTHLVQNKTIIKENIQ